MFSVNLLISMLNDTPDGTTHHCAQCERLQRENDQLQQANDELRITMLRIHDLSKFEDCPVPLSAAMPQRQPSSPTLPSETA
jgi:hypothetical protein